MPRSFTSRQRIALYLAANGLCEVCGSELDESFHADHVVPYSKGGKTDVLNGQALCPECNLKKSDKMNIKPFPTSPPLRAWQHEALQHYQAAGECFLIQASPGAGKTKAAARIAHDLLSRSLVRRVVIVSPTDHIRRQWAAKMQRHGMDVSDDWRFGKNMPSDIVGISITYHQAANSSDILRLFCSEPTLVILDEIHHCGDEKTWGESILHAFKGTHIKKLGLSGTPFRSDNNFIPFVEYDEDLTSKSDPPYGFSYGYGDALADEVVRHVVFPSFDSRAVWMDGYGTKEHTFEDDLSDKDQSARLRAVISAKGTWLPPVLRDANDKLTEIRETHPDAGGLVITPDKGNIYGIAKLLREVTGEDPVVVTSEMDDASDRIEAYANDNSRWIVAIKMVSEGVDIPRLRVGVYATNITTELFVRQAVGRVIRKTDDGTDDTAWFYIPKDPRLVEIVNRIREQRDHVIEADLESSDRGETEGETEGETDLFDSIFEVISSDAFGKVTYMDGDEIDESLLAKAEIMKLRVPDLKGLQTEYVAYLMTQLRDAMREDSDDGGVMEYEGEAIDVRKQRLGRKINTKAFRLASMTGRNVNDVHKEFNMFAGQYVGRDSQTEDQLEKKSTNLSRAIVQFKKDGYYDTP